MPLINYLKHFKADVEKVLQPGEQLIDLGLYHAPLVGDESRLERTRDELSPRMRRYADRHGSPPPSSPPSPSGKLFSFDLFTGLDVNDDRVARFFGGRSGEGSVDSVAGRWWRAAKDLSSAEYGVTNRRLLLLNRPAGEDAYEIAFSVPREQVAFAARRGKLLFQRGRVEVRFTDRSMIAFTTGLLTTGRARSLVAALADRRG
jgi:hypothetical protein